MRFVQPKTMEEQARPFYFPRWSVVRQRTQVINALRSQVYEFDYAVPQGSAC